MTPTRYCREPHLAVVRLTGADAIRFLHAQTTQKLDDFRPNETRLAAWLNPKGRVLALFDVVADGEDLLLILPADNAENLVHGLRRFILRSRLRIERDEAPTVFSLTGSLDGWLAARGSALPVSAVAVDGTAILARVAPDRAIVLGGDDLPAGLLAGLDETGTDDAAAADIAAGRAEIPAGLRERYVPQMLNLDRLGAVSFTKGCYPGQEIVARAQNLGQVKRRMRRLRVPAGDRPLAGDGVVDPAGVDVGEVIRAAAIKEGFELLAVVGTEAAHEGLRLAGSGRPLAPVDLPGDGAAVT